MLLAFFIEGEQRKCRILYLVGILIFGAQNGHPRPRGVVWTNPQPRLSPITTSMSSILTNIKLSSQHPKSRKRAILDGLDTDLFFGNTACRRESPLSAPLGIGGPYWAPKFVISFRYKIRHFLYSPSLRNARSMIPQHFGTALSHS